MKSATIQSYKPLCLIPRKREDRGLALLNPEQTDVNEIQLCDEEINDAMAADNELMQGDFFDFNL